MDNDDTHTHSHTRKTTDRITLETLRTAHTPNIYSIFNRWNQINFCCLCSHLCRAQYYTCRIYVAEIGFPNWQHTHTHTHSNHIQRIEWHIMFMCAVRTQQKHNSTEKGRCYIYCFFMFVIALCVSAGHHLELARILCVGRYCDGCRRSLSLWCHTAQYALAHWQTVHFVRMRNCVSALKRRHFTREMSTTSPPIIFGRL